MGTGYRFKTTLYFIINETEKTNHIFYSNPEPPKEDHLLLEDEHEEVKYIIYCIPHENNKGKEAKLYISLGKVTITYR